MIDCGVIVIIVYISSRLLVQLYCIVKVQWYSRQNQELVRKSRPFAFLPEGGVCVYLPCVTPGWVLTAYIIHHQRIMRENSINQINIKSTMIIIHHVENERVDAGWDRRFFLPRWYCQEARTGTDRVETIRSFSC